MTTLAADRWVKRAMNLPPIGARRLGRPRNSWQTHLKAFAGFPGFDSGNECVSNFCDVARDAFSDFVQRRTQQSSVNGLCYDDAMSCSTAV